MAKLQTYKTLALVLRKTKLGERDLIVTLLAESGALLKCVAKGARKPGGSFAANGSFSVASFIFEAFAVDWGVPTHSHRDALLNSAFTEVGLSISSTSKAVGPYVATNDFGTSVLGARTDGAYLLGAVFDDSDRDFFYDAGEGLGGATLTIERLDGSETPQKVEITSATAGGYQLFLLNGTYRVTVSGEGFASPVSKTVSINDGINAKLDFRTADASAAPPVVDLNGEETEGTGGSAVFVEGAVDSLEALAASRVDWVSARVALVDSRVAWVSFSAALVLERSADSASFSAVMVLTVALRDLTSPFRLVT